MKLIEILEKRIAYLEELCTEQQKYIIELQKEIEELKSGLPGYTIRIN